MSDAQRETSNGKSKRVVKRIAKLFILSAGLFSIVGLSRYFDSVWQQAPKTVKPFDATWTISILIAITTGAIILGMFYLAAPATYRVISKALGIDEPEPQ